MPKMTLRDKNKFDKKYNPSKDLAHVTPERRRKIHEIDSNMVDIVILLCILDGSL